jgi:transposase
VNIEQLCLLLLNTDRLILQNIRLDEGKIRLSVESMVHSASCPVCARVSFDIHSHYMRYPTDLAWAEWPVIIHLKVKRFFCRNQACPKRTFAERFPNV